MAPTHRLTTTAVTLVETITAHLKEQIVSGALLYGNRLLSVRKAASEFNVSKNTVVEAYDRLVAGGFIAARKGSGFTVVFEPDTTTNQRPKHVAEAVDIASLLSAQLDQSFQIRVGDGRPPPAWTEQSEIKRHLMIHDRSLTTDSDAYGSALGFPLLREKIAHRLRSQHIHAEEANILLSFGANHALDLIIRGLLSAGDTVLVDDPGYYPLFAKLALAQIRMVGVRRTPEGPDISDFSEKLKSERPKMFFTQSLGHNPMGSSITLPVAHAILAAASTHDIIIVEDDPFCDLPLPSAHRLATLDQVNRVISVGTFSKTLSASLRSGFIVAREDIIAALAELKMLTTVNSSGHIERLLHRLIAEGHYDRHLKRLWQRIETASDEFQHRIDQAGWQCFSNDVGGYYKYLLLPAGVNDLELARAGAQESIFIAPGSVFCIDKQNPLARGIRINVSRAQDMRFYDFLLRML
ncbi:PLP-dependent aminotransferase family protein [Ochrobactrum sp. Marseille-Q0166]|uniref:aminotransferase-like domain-containing protein n=1 Tax=Ochrobactrum sp. Marseille-Q0166 TaxID=2761105 RepID=UPI00165662A7|nr:PLP-dependent aminotransferase family protein [Ochrobactrum sp. Marseille-Q0166]MBC8719640.1 PLP-dependent aminotransferase family protein [Ochrobactrum sp. Marseille-Q0166]